MQEQDTRKKYIFSITARTCMRLGITFFLVYLAVTWWKPLLKLIGRVINASAPLLIGFVLAYIVNILMSMYERHYFPNSADRSWVKKSRRAVCLIGAVATIIGATALLLWLIMPQLVGALNVITQRIPVLLHNISRDEKIMRLLPEGIQESVRNLDYDAIVQGVLGFLLNGASSPGSAMSGLSSLTGIVGSLTSGLMTGFMGFIFSIYILIGKERLAAQFNRLFRAYLSVGWMKKLSPFLAVANNSFHNFIVGQVAEAIIIGILCAVGMWICRLPYAAMIGTVIGVTALIPVLGCYLGAAIGALMCLSVSPVKAVEFLVFIFVLQQFEDNLIYPRVVGTTIGLPGIWVLASVAVGGGIGGIIGMILAVPVASTIYQLVRRDVRIREEKSNKRLTAADVVSRLKEEADS